MSSFFLDSKNSILGFSNEVSFDSKIFWEGNKIPYYLMGGPKHMAHPVQEGHLDARVLQFGEVTQIVAYNFQNNWFLFSGIPQNVGLIIF